MRLQGMHASPPPQAKAHMAMQARAMMAAAAPAWAGGGEVVEGGFPADADRRTKSVRESSATQAKGVATHRSR